MGLLNFYRKVLWSSPIGSYSAITYVLKQVSHSPHSETLTRCISSCRVLSSPKLHDISCNNKSAQLRHVHVSKLLTLNIQPQTEHKTVNERPALRKPNESHSLKELSPFAEKIPQKQLYNNIVEDFPEGIQMAFAYGSGVFQQHNSLEKTRNMLDFIFVVDKPKKWHSQNLEKHSHHYSFLKKFGPHTIARIQERYGAGIYFNTLVPMQGRLIKYGVISTARLITDLLDWESLYISGRLHKPISLIILPTNEDLITAMKVNLRSAVHAALLLLPDMFTEEQLYTTITSLSYAGDFRMGIAEDNNKVSNIVKPNLQLFRRMYGPILREEEHVTWWQNEGQFEQASTFHSRHHHLKCLPGQVLYGLLMHKFQIGVFPDLEEIITRHAYDSDCGKHVASSIRHIVKKSSVTQTLKGILTAGFSKSIKYALNKVFKKLKSK
ncbi:unnamed protein product [Lymnaea stagnalis]|uniref:Phosphatidate cytidylyltransferase, mitochondrial n=1 Tax=Lymnaea stagnalis TaxID=6523 RepID=A0AAV2ING6_LYMST